MERMTCPCCLSLPPSLETRFDVKGRPYCTCSSCSARVFVRGSQSLVGLAMLNPLATTLAEKITTDRATWEVLQTTRRQVEASLRRVSTPEPETLNAATLVAAVGGSQ